MADCADHHYFCRLEQWFHEKKTILFYTYKNKIKKYQKTLFVDCFYLQTPVLSFEGPNYLFTL